MQQITVFRNIHETTEPLFVDVIEILKRIKDGNSESIITKIRESEDKDERYELKKRLPSICFSGRFGKREAEALLEHSGLIILDIDDINQKDLQSIKEIIIADSFTMSCFISPSGLGYKILIQIAPERKHHKTQFLALEQHFNKLLYQFTSTKKNEKKLKDKTVKIDESQGDFLRVCIDKSGKDISRVCYESYDPDIYYNPDSDMWYEVLEEKVEEKSIHDQDRIIELLQKWIDKAEYYSEGNRNNYLSKFLYALCRYGVNEFKAKSYISNKFPGVPEKDLDAITKSCYSKNDYGTAQFTEKEYKQGFTATKIEFKKDVVAFWSINDKGKVKIDAKQFLKFIETNGFGIYRSNREDEKFKFVFVENMIVDIVTVLDIKRHILDYVEKNAPEPVFDELQMKNRYFENTFLNALPIIHVEQIRDTIDSSFLFFEDFYYEITKDKKTKHGYIDLQGKHIWRSQICKKSITEIIEYDKHDFNLFVYNAMDEDKDKYKSICSAIGYGIHTYKKKRLTKLIYSCDAGVGELDGMAMGGTGKELAFECLNFVRAVVPIDGKVFDKKDKFNFQTVTDDTQIIIINDYEGDIKELFNRVTGHFEIERKMMNKTIIEFSESPKIFCSSNTSPKGFSDSFKRRLLNIEFSNYYSATHTPADDFGDKDFFSDDWTQDDYNALYSFLFDCVQYYLKNGLQEMDINEGENQFKTLVKNCGRDFAEYFKDYEFDGWITGRTIFDEYKMEAEDITIQEFYAKMRKLCGIYGWRLDVDGRGIYKKIMVVK